MPLAPAPIGTPRPRCGTHHLPGRAGRRASPETWWNRHRPRSDPGRAGCVTRVGPVHSTYRWRESIQDEPEVLLVVKTVSTRYPELEMRLKSLHTYPVPEIIALPVTSGSADYVSWLQGAVE
ncbi:MAG: divalent-cation tolerance protein CutA [Steroidobacteraceae bacterium]